MSHFINLGLLLSYSTLALSGVLSFIQPFSLTVARIHIVFGFITFVLVGGHLFKKLSYFKKQFKLRPKLYLICSSLWLALLCGTFYNTYPARLVMEQSYEAKNRKQIIRPAPVVASLKKPLELISSRKKENSNETLLSVHVALQPTCSNKAAMAIWAETKAGSMIETLYISETLAYSDKPMWNGKATARHNILPIWRHRYTTMSGIDPDGKVDAASGATENHSFSLESYLNVEADEYVIFFEINVPNDSDEQWHDADLGQPSVLYSAYVEHREKNKYTLLELTGHGGGAEKSGMIHYDLNQISSAKELVDLVLVYSRHATDAIKTD